MDMTNNSFAKETAELLEHFNQMSQIFLNKEEFFTLVFFCDFDIEKYVFE